MTTTAKILVVLNLLLAVLFLGFSAASFNGRLNLEGRITNLEKEKKDAADKAAVEKQSADKADIESKSVQSQFNLAKKQADEEAKRFNNTIENLTADNTTYRKQVDVTEQRLKQATAESTQRKEEIDQARKQNQDLVAKNVQAANDLSNARDQIQDLKNQLERINEKLRVAEDKNKKTLDYMIAMKYTPPTPEDLENRIDSATPPPPVEGIVKDVREGGKLMEISLGENDGLRPKHKLSLWRPNKYLGEVQVIYTQPDRAVVQPVDAPLTAPPQKGDRVGPSPLLNRG